MFVNFSEEVRHILKNAEKERDDLNHPYVGSEHLFLSILKNSKLKDILKKHKVTYDKFKEKLISLVGVGSKKSKFVLYTPLLKRVLENAVIEAREENNKVVNPEIIIISILDEEDGIAYTILKSFNVNIDRLYYDLRIKKNNKNNKRKKLLLDEQGTDLTRLAKEKKLDPVIGREKEIDKVVEILLRRKKNNPILIGPAGVGKTAIVEGIANLMVSDKCPSFLKDKKIISLNIFSLVSGTKYRGEFEEKMKTLIKELEDNPDIILFIDEIHTMVGAGGAEGAIDASNIFKPALARGGVRIIGATTEDEYKKYIEPDLALARRFQSVIVKEPDTKSVIKILTEIKPLYEKYHNIKIDNSLIKEIVYLSDRYLTNRFEPDKSIDILDEVCAKASILESKPEKMMKRLNEKLKKTSYNKNKALSNNDFKKAYLYKSMENDIKKELEKITIYKKKVTKKDVLDVIRSKGNINGIGDKMVRRRFYNSLESNLNKTIIGQEEAVKKIVNSLKRNDLSKNKRCYSLIITGPKGTGKTLLATEYLKLISNLKDIVKIDLSEYKEYHMISKLIGTTAGYLGYDNKNNIFEKVRSNPSTTFIVENFSQACTEVKSLFERILSDGKIEDASGKKIDFTNSVIIFENRNLENEKKLGFTNDDKSNLNLPSEIKDKVFDVIELKKLTNKDKEEILINKINNLIKNYDDAKVKLPAHYKEEILKLISSSKDLKSLINDSLIKIENQITEGLINYKSDIELKI